MSAPDPSLIADPVQPSAVPSPHSEPHFRAAFDHMLDGMMLLDDDARFLYVNPAMYRMFGLAPDALLGRTIFDVRRILQAEALAEAWMLFLERGYYHGELSIPRGMVGSWDIEVNAVAHIYPGQHMIVIRDITERKRADTAQRASEARFATAFRASPDAMSISDLFTGRILDVNDHWVTMFGYSRAEALGQLLPDLVLWTDQTSYEQLLTRLRAEEVIHELEVTFRQKSGQICDGLLSVELIELDGALCALTIQRDITERKRAEEALRASEERFATAFRASPYMAGISQLQNGRIIEVNAVWEQLSGYRREEALGRTVGELGLWSDPADRARLISGMREQGSVHDLEVGFRSRAGKVHRVSLSAVIITVRGEPCLLSMSIDVTEQRLAEAALRASEERFATAFRATPDAMSITRIRDGVIVDVNDSWLRSGNYRRDEVLGRAMHELNVWHDPVVQDQLIARLYAQGSVRNFETSYNHEGDVRNALISADLIDLDGEPCLLVVTRDVTEQKQAAAQLRLLGAAVQYANAAITLVAAAPDPASGSIVFVNPAFTQLTGYAADDVVGRNFSLLQGPVAEETVFEQVRAALALGQMQGEALLYRKDGSEYLAEWYLTPVRNDEGATTHWMALLRDVTARRAMENRVRAAERLGALGSVAAGVAHEFNNILAGIMGRLDLLEQEIQEPGPQATLGVIQRAVEDGAKVVHRIQEFSRLREVGALIPVALSEVVQDVIALTQPRWQTLPAAKGIVLTLQSQVAPGLGVLGDATELREVLTNLIHNAVEAMPEGGQLTIHAEQQGTQVVLTVRDTGVGMDAVAQERAFEPFFTTKVSGTGLGLVVVRDIVQHHGGTIHIASALGSGTTVTLAFPSVAPPLGLSTAPPLLGLPAAPPPPPVAVAGTARILVVDDDPSLTSMLRQLLILAGHEVLTANSGIEALALIDQYTFDLVCTDLGMPGMNGWELARAVRQRAPGTPIALITVWGAELDPADVAANHVDFVLPKPYRAAEVKHLIAQALAQQKEPPDA